MANIAELAFGAETSQLVEAEKRLKKIKPAAADAEKAADELGKSFDDVAKSTDRARDAKGRFIPAVKKASDQIYIADKRTGAFAKTLNVLRGASHAAVAALGGVVGRMIAMGVAMLGIGSMIPTLAGFETQMSAVAAVSRATDDELQKLRDTAKTLGSTTEFSASQAAEGLRFLSMAGFNASESIAAIPAVLDLATAAQMDLGSASDITSNIMGGFGIAASQAASVADVLAAASSRANTDVAQLGQAMSTVAPVSKTLGISLADTAAAIGVMSDAGIQAERAGTAMRGAMAALASPTKAAQEALAKYGISVESINPATNDLADVLDRLKPLANDAGAAMQVFGREAASGALVLINGSQRVREFGQELRNVDGEASRMAAMFRDNLGGSINGLKSAIEGVVIAMGEAGLTALLRALIDIATQFFRVMGSVVTVIGELMKPLDVVTPALQFLADNFQTVASYAAAAALVYGASFVPALYAGATAIAINAVGLMTQLVPAMIATATASFTAVGALTAFRFALIKTGIGAAIVAIGYLIAKFLELNEKVGGVGRAFGLLGDIGREVADRIGKGFVYMGDMISGVAGYIKGVMLEAFATIARGFAKVMTTIAKGLEVIGIGNGVGVGSEFADQLTKDADAAISAGHERVSGAAAKLRELTGPLDVLKKFNEEIENTGNASDAVIPSVDDLNDTLNNLGGAGDLGGGSGGGAEKGAGKALTELQKIEEQLNKLSEPFDQASAAVQAAQTAMENGIIGNDAYVASLQRIQQAFLAAGGSADQWAKIMEKDTESVATQLDNLAKNSFVQLSDQIAELAVGGSADFEQFAKSIVKQLISIAIQALIVKPLLASLGFADGGAIDGGGQVSQFATGGVFDDSPTRVRAFAGGGTFTNSVVDQATPFSFGGGSQLGVMGEAGPEGILPLKRGADGSLGVQMFGSGAARSGQDRVALDIHVTGEEGPMFRPTIKSVASDESVKITTEAVKQMNEQLPERVAQINADDRLR